MPCARWCAALLSALPVAVAAQAPRESLVRTEVRADAIFARASLLHAGLGAALRTGYNIRVHVVGAAGTALKDGATEFTARGDATIRLLLDPFGESRTGLSVGGGLGVLYDGFEETRPVGLLVLGLEGAPRAAVVWALEVGLGGGARVGIALRPRASRHR